MHIDDVLRDRIRRIDSHIESFNDNNEVLMKEINNNNNIIKRLLDQKRETEQMLKIWEEKE